MIRYILLLICAMKFFLVFSQENCKDSLKCYVSQFYEEGEFSIKRDYLSEATTINYQTCLLIDIDGDCHAELLMAGIYGFRSNPRITSGLSIVNSTNGMTKKSFPTVFYAWTAPLAFVAGDIDKDGNVEIIVAAADHSLNPAHLRGHLVCYDLDGNIKWISNEKFGKNVSHKYGGSPALADFNQDGVAEVYIYNEIFNAENGVKLADGGNNGLGLGSNNFDLGSLSLTIAAQLDEDESDLELAAGYTIYKVHIVNPNGEEGNFMHAINYRLNGQLRDGLTSIGDVNSDGRIDVIVASRGDSDYGKLYCYTLNDNNNSQLIAKVTPPTTIGASTENIGAAFIGDMVGNGQVSIGITRPDRLIMYDYDGTTEFKVRWILGTNDRSGLTGLTMFDFDQNGIKELVYRDETHLRIIKGTVTPPVDLARFSCISGTGMEYPIIGELDNSGESKICIPCGENGSRTLGKLNIFSSGIENLPWAPSRGIWNQYGYHVFNIEDDLKVPVIQLNNATYASGKFNNYFTQANYVDGNGKFIQPAVNLGGEITCVKFNENTRNIEITFSLTNDVVASLSVPSGIKISFYHGNPDITGILIGTYTTSFVIDPGVNINDLIFTFGISDLNFSEGIFMLINSNGKVNEDITDPENFNVIECDFENNIVHYPNKVNFKAFSVTICEGDSFDFFETSLNESGIYYERLLNRNGCDSILSILQLDLSFTVSEELNISACESFVFNNEIIYQSGSYYLETANQFDCDSLVTLNLVILEPTTIYLEEFACSEFYWEVADIICQKSGLYEHILVGEMGCDTLLQLNLQLNTPEIISEVINICEGEEYIFDERILDKSGNYISRVLDLNGCDSIITYLSLTIHEHFFDKLAVIECDTFDWNGSKITESGEYIFEGISRNGCDSTIILKLDIRQQINYSENHSGCNEFYWSTSGVTYLEGGNYSFRTIDEYGCDTLFHLYLTIHRDFIETETIHTDQDYFWRVTNSVISESGEYEEIFSNQFGCDSIHRLKIIIEKFRSIWVPNIFSPNFDGLHDQVFVHANGVDEIIKLSIYNRWGALVFEQNNFPPNNPLYSWNGIYKGQPLNSDVFVYVIQWTGNSGNIEEVSGDITIIR